MEEPPPTRGIKDRILRLVMAPVLLISRHGGRILGPFQALGSYFSSYNKFVTSSCNCRKGARSWVLYRDLGIRLLALKVRESTDQMR